MMRSEEELRGEVYLGVADILETRKRMLTDELEPPPGVTTDTEEFSDVLAERTFVAGQIGALITLLRSAALDCVPLQKGLVFTGEMTRSAQAVTARSLAPFESDRSPSEILGREVASE